MPVDIKVCFKQLPNPSAEEVRECFPETKSTPFKMKRMNDAGMDKQFMVSQEYMPDGGFSDSGNASRFFKSIPQGRFPANLIHDNSE